MLIQSITIHMLMTFDIKISIFLIYLYVSVTGRYAQDQCDLGRGA